MESKEFWEDMEWGQDNYTELQKRFKDKWVAIVDKAVVSFGVSMEEVKKEAQKKTKRKSIPIIFVECGSHLY
ncbi:MAG: DUF5678 domain-containing protein [Candidatus Methanofastidiosia archaeon]